MPQYGLGNFVYELEVKDNAAHFKFSDPEDASNTAEVSVSQKDFPEGITTADSRQVADMAYAQCQKILNDKRDARFKKQATDALEAKTAEDARAREAAHDFLNNAQDVATEPHHVEEDGTRVYNVEPQDEGGKSTDQKSKK
jgi:hypothetical protein